jgi:hypothetical protein
VQIAWYCCAGVAVLGAALLGAALLGAALLGAAVLSTAVLVLLVKNWLGKVAPEKVFIGLPTKYQARGAAGGKDNGDTKRAVVVIGHS